MKQLQISQRFLAFFESRVKDREFHTVHRFSNPTRQTVEMDFTNNNLIWFETVLGQIFCWISISERTSEVSSADEYFYKQIRIIFLISKCPSMLWFQKH